MINSVAVLPLNGLRSELRNMLRGSGLKQTEEFTRLIKLLLHLGNLAQEVKCTILDHGMTAIRSSVTRLVH